MESFAVVAARFEQQRSCWLLWYRWWMVAVGRFFVLATLPCFRLIWCARWPRCASCCRRRSRLFRVFGRRFEGGRLALRGLAARALVRIGVCWILCLLWCWSRSRSLGVCEVRLRGTRFDLWWPSLNGKKCIINNFVFFFKQNFLKFSWNRKNWEF